MARPKLRADSEIYQIVIAALHDRGEKGLSFGAISKASGLAPATLAQRFGSVDGMVRAAALHEWARLLDAVTAAEAEGGLSAKGAQALLKSLPSPAAQLMALSLRDAALRDAAEAWRGAVEAALAARRGGGTKGRTAAALLFAAWQGRQLWDAAGGKTFRLSDLVKSLG